MSAYSSNHSSVHLFTLQLPALTACLRRSSFLSKATWTLALGSFKLFLPSPSPPHRGESCLFRQTTASLLGGGMGLSAQDVVTAEVTGHFCPLPVPSSQLPRLESRWPYKPWLRGSVRRVKETLGLSRAGNAQYVASAHKPGCSSSPCTENGGTAQRF